MSTGPQRNGRDHASQLGFGSNGDSPEEGRSAAIRMERAKLQADLQLGRNTQHSRHNRKQASNEQQQEEGQIIGDNNTLNAFRTGTDDINPLSADNAVVQKTTPAQEQSVERMSELHWRGRASREGAATKDQSQNLSVERLAQAVIEREKLPESAKDNPGSWQAVEADPANLSFFAPPATGAQAPAKNTVRSPVG